MKHVRLVGFALLSASAFAAACSGFSSSDAASSVSDGGTLPGEGGVVDDSDISAESGSVDSGVTPPGPDEAGCPTAKEVEEDDAGIKRVFVTLSTNDGNLGGLAGADAICQNLGNSAYGGNWHAWLSTNACPVEDRFVARGRFLVDGSYVGKVGPKFVPTSPLATKDLRAWTGTASSGGATGSDCAGWTSRDAGLVGTQGSAQALTNENWTNVAGAKCDQPGRLYCFEL